MSARYHVDEVHAARVAQTALALLEQVADAWSLDREEGARLLGWAASMHEIGLVLAHRGHHKHGAYILANSNMAGFSREDQERLAALVRSHRRRLDAVVFEAFPSPLREQIFRLSILLRLAVRLHRARTSTPLPAFRLRAEVGGTDGSSGDALTIELPEEWLADQPLTRADLLDEAEVLGLSGFRLTLAPLPPAP
jgi:exopolyphosphatase/guanosine-5'-triphosphate,3'-diphosphate pyrophosphatase